MDDFEKLAATICERPGMYLGARTFAAVCAYLEGFDAARDGGPLMGFHPWLVLRQKRTQNLPWSSFVLREALPNAPMTQQIDNLSPEDEERCITKLSVLLSAFFEDRRSKTVIPIFRDYGVWLESRTTTMSETSDDR